MAKVKPSLLLASICPKHLLNYNSTLVSLGKSFGQFFQNLVVFPPISSQTGSIAGSKLQRAPSFSSIGRGRQNINKITT
jgi:hypothetical protein